MWRMCSIMMLERPPSVPFVRHISLSNMLSKSHYDVLGLTPKATQNDIKTAYYKLSMLYHPDKNKGADASSAFRDITTAYEVLGNYKLRKLYDRGLLHTAGADQAAAHVYENPEEKFYQSRASRHSTPESSGKTPIYDFDEWARQHYGSSFAKRASAKAKWEHSQRLRVTSKGEMQSEKTILVVAITVFSFVVVTYVFSESHDVDRTKKVKSENSANS